MIMMMMMMMIVMMMLTGQSLGEVDVGLDLLYDWDNCFIDDDFELGVQQVYDIGGYCT